LSRGTRLARIASVIKGVFLIIGHKVSVAGRCGSTTGREIRTITGGILGYKDWLFISKLRSLLASSGDVG